jgi:hypothetical protein
MTDREQITVCVTAARYEEWKDVAEREYDGMEDLIRTAVEREIEGEHDTKKREDVTLSEILEALRNPYE